MFPMKKMIRRLSLVLALILCFSVCCAGLASAESAESAESGESTGDNTEMFMAIMQLIPGMDQIDWEGFRSEEGQRCGDHPRGLPARGRLDALRLHAVLG